MEEKILVVDDEPLILNTINRTLIRKGYQVRTAPDAQTFLDELERETADLLIMDINLGELSSQTLVDSIREIAPKAKMLFISGGMPEANVEHFLEKPFDIDDLRLKVRNILDSK
jgi:two-component system nitrogen regulation response regulator NtrX